MVNQFEEELSKLKSKSADYLVSIKKLQQSLKQADESIYTNK